MPYKLFKITLECVNIKLRREILITDLHLLQNKEGTTINLVISFFLG